MKEEELKFIARMYDEYYNHRHVSETDAIRFQNLIARLREVSEELIKSVEV